MDKKVAESIIETDHEKTLSDGKLKKECFLYARKQFQGKSFHNLSINRDILVSRDGLDEWFSKTKSREQALSIKKLDLILMESIKVGSDTDRKGRDFVEGYTYFNYEIEINEKQFKAVMMTREIINRNPKYYYHYLEDIKIEPNSGLA